MSSSQGATEASSHTDEVVIGTIERVVKARVVHLMLVGQRGHAAYAEEHQRCAGVMRSRWRRLNNAMYQAFSTLIELTQEGKPSEVELKSVVERCDTPQVLLQDVPAKCGKTILA